MPALDWSQCPVVESVPGKVSGAWVFKGTRTPVAIIFENLEDGMTIDEVMDQFPVTREQVKADTTYYCRRSNIAPKNASRPWTCGNVRRQPRASTTAAGRSVARRASTAVKSSAISRKRSATASFSSGSLEQVA